MCGRERQTERERESKGTDGPGRGKRYNPISCTINRPSGHPTAQLQHISAGRTKDGFAGPHQTCLSVTIRERRPSLLRSWISFDVLPNHRGLDWDLSINLFDLLGVNRTSAGGGGGFIGDRDVRARTSQVRPDSVMQRSGRLLASAHYSRCLSSAEGGIVRVCHQIACADCVIHFATVPIQHMLPSLSVH